MLLTLVLGAALAAPAIALAAGPQCTPDLLTAGACVETVNNGSQVDLIAGRTGTGGADGQDQRSDSSAPASPIATTPAAAEDCGPVGCRDNYTVGVIPTVTIEDLASFRPAAPTLAGEPAGFGVVGMPTNLVATASEQRIPGTLFDWDVTVRFTPAAFVFDHGDGTSARRQTGGATWASLGLTQFDPTATSHVYGARGSYRVSASVDYTAAVDFGDGRWRPVAGYVSATGGGYDVRVVEVRTALVDATCIEDPAGPGC